MDVPDSLIAAMALTSVLSMAMLAIGAEIAGPRAFLFLAPGTILGVAAIGLGLAFFALAN